MVRAIASFPVSYRRFRLRVRVLPTVQDVHREYQKQPGSRMRRGKVVHAFMREQMSGAAVAVITLPAEPGTDYDELLPHEVGHALLVAFGTVTRDDDEPFATALGILCSRIRRRLRIVGVAS